MIKFLCYIFSVFLLCSCKSQEVKLEEGVFLEVTKENVLFYPCSATINTIILTDNSIKELVGQETIEGEVLKKEKKDNIIQIELKNKNNYTFELIDSDKHYWKINNRIYVEEKYSDLLETIKEPCTKCFSEEECEYFKKINKELTLNEFIYKDKKTIETVKGDFNNDNLEDLIIITDISDKNDVSEYYLLTVLLQSTQKGLYKLLFESSSILPCLNCKEWSNDSDYSYYDMKLDKGTLSFSTNKTNESLNKWSTNIYLFKNIKGQMKLQKVTKKFGKLDSDDEETKELDNLFFLNLKQFNILSH